MLRKRGSGLLGPRSAGSRLGRGRRPRGLCGCLWEALDRGRQPHGSDRSTAWNRDPAPVNLDAGKLKLGDQAGRELDPGLTKLFICHRLPQASGEDAQQVRLLVVKRRASVRAARSAFIRLHVHVPDLRCRDLAIVPVAAHYAATELICPSQRRRRLTDAANEVPMPNVG